MSHCIMKVMAALRLNLSAVSKKRVAILGIVLICISDSYAWLMPWPGLPPALSLTGRTRRHIQSPVANPLNYIMSHPLNSDRPVVTSLGQKLDRDEFEKVMSGFKFKDGMSLDYIFDVYSVTDGVDGSDTKHLLTHLYLVPGYFLLSLDDGLETYRRLSLDPSANLHGSQIAPLAAGDWFPIMSSGKGDYIMVNLYDGSVVEYKQGKSLTADHDNVKFKDVSEFFQFYSELFHNDEIQLIDGVLTFEAGEQSSNKVSELGNRSRDSDKNESKPSLLKRVLRL